MRLRSKLAVAAVILAGAGGLAAITLTGPNRLSADELALFGPGDAARGERIFWAGGCASCHAKEKSEGEELFELEGDIELETPFGDFVAPNISQHPDDGIGAWSLEDFANAMTRGVAPDGRHYYPAFPYASYARMQPGDISDLYAFLQTLPAVEGSADEHKLSFPFNIRRGLGLWKQLYLSDEPVIALGEDVGESVRRGRYLVEGAGHCGECHTPRAFTGGVDKDQWLAGAVAAEGDDVVPNITSGEGGIGDWSQSDIVALLETGFTPDFDTVDGEMAEVVRNTARLSAEDRAAIAAYLKAVPERPNGYPARDRR